MHNKLVTPFWKNALQSLPAELRPRYVQQIEQAERWELRLDAIVEAWSRANAAFGRTFHTPTLRRALRTACFAVRGKSDASSSSSG